MKLFLSLAAVAAALTLATTAPALAAGHAPQHARHHVQQARWHLLSLKQKRQVVVAEIARQQRPVRWWIHIRHRLPESIVGPFHFCADIGIRTPSTICSHARRLVRAVHVLRRIDANLAAAARAREMRIPLTNDWMTAVAQVQRVFPRSADWLAACSSSEGGHGGWVWNGGYPLSLYPTKPASSSGAGGWMQYMEGTFWGDYAAAAADARGRGFIVPAGSASYYSATGQALAGGWAYWHNRPAGKWTGDLC